MLSKLFFFSLICLCFINFSICETNDIEYDYICICNRNGASVSIVDPNTDKIIQTLDVVVENQGETPPQPMYCDYHETADGTRYFSVGERVYSKLIIYEISDEGEFVKAAEKSTGPGIFHHWVHPTAGEQGQIWVICDGQLNAETKKDKDLIGVWIFDATSFEELFIWRIPSDLRKIIDGTNAQLHDVAISPDGEFAVVTSYQFEGSNDWAFRISTDTFQEIARLAVGKLAHCTFSQYEEETVYIASQASILDSIMVVSTANNALTKVSSVQGIAGAHMIEIGGPGIYYATNLPGGGLDGLYAFDVSTHQVDFSATTDVPHSVPHNIASNRDRTKLYLTHSGVNFETTIWDISDKFNPRPKLIGEIVTAQNPYGIKNFQSTADLGGSQSSNSNQIVLPSIFITIGLILISIIF